MPFSPEEAEAIAQLQNALYTNPATRQDYLKLVKKVAPRAAIPEIDVPDAALASIKPQLDKIDKLETRLERNERQHAIEAEWGKQQVTPQEREEVEKLMTDRLIGDVATAVQFYRDRRPPPPAAPLGSPTPVSLPTGEGFKGLFENPTKWARETAYQAIGEIQRTRS